MKSINSKFLHDLEQDARNIAKDILTHFHQSGIGFCLLLFSFNGPELTYISNSDREDMIKLLKEFIEKLESGTHDELSRPKGRG